MIDVYGQLWDYPADVRVITTNGFVKQNGEAVMGRGCALEATKRFYDIQRVLGRVLTAGGNHVYDLFVPTGPITARYEHVLTFPVKHHWREQADLNLIERSARELVEVVDERGWGKVVLPRPGCGNGGLAYDAVRPVIAPILDHRFHVITFV